MKTQDGQIRLSATDLANHLACRHLTSLNLAEARGEAKRPVWNDPALAVLRERGFQHEAAYLDYLRSCGHSVVRLDDLEVGDSAFEKTKAAMQAGEDIIVQATLVADRWFGRADILHRVDRPSKLGEWSYEVIDTKLARETRAGTILQLCLYSEIVSEIQGTPPEHMYVVSPARGLEPERFRVQDYLAYYRLVKRRLEAEVHRSVGSPGARTYPDPVAHCDICLWLPNCEKKRREDDHLCLVAETSKLQRTELQDRGIHTLESLADLPLPLPWRPKRGSPEGYERVREQARIQREGRREESPVHELLPREIDRGLARLPEPSPGDIFFDIEGDPFVGESGLEYLFGCVIFDDRGEAAYQQQWALDQGEERAAFENFVDFVIDRWSRFSDLHIYHFAPYEPSALKRLMGRYATREEEVDRMLRARLFIDLHAITKQAVRASVERYSLKALEVFFGFKRETPLPEALPNLLAIERALELGDVTNLTEETRSVVESYNRDDCLSAKGLRDWLESERARLAGEGEQVPRPTPESGEPSATIDERRQRALFLMDRLLQGVPTDGDERSAEQKAHWLLAHMLEWHRREDKAPWSEFYRLRDLSDEELVDEQGAVSGLRFVERVGGSNRSPIDRYEFQPQETKIRGKDDLHTTDGEKFGKVDAIDLVAGTIDVKKRGAVANVHPTALFAHSFVSSDKLSDSLLRLGRWVASQGIDGDGPYRAARDLVLRHSPRLVTGASELQRKDEDTVEAAKRLALELDGGVLPIQGPPGSGKTYTGARMICELVKTGKKVGVTAVSHKVIRKLLEEVLSAAIEEGVDVRCLQKVSGRPSDENPDICEVSGNGDVENALSEGRVDLVGGTAWLWAREEFSQTVDVLFVDEAGQMSLANVLAVAQAAKNIVLLGDPRQLDQPQQGSHPEGTDVSALEHLLGGHKTMPEDRGLFLPVTWRLHPAICKFTSEVFYEDRLTSRPDLKRQALSGPISFLESGLWFEPVVHEGSQSSSPQEVERVAELVGLLQKEGVAWTDREGCTQPLTLDDILIVAPYNAQVADLGKRLPGARVGTVDKFQGQQAPVVIYSMTTSSPEEAPHGMEFLYSLNRLNVATSRARCVCILVASPLLFEPECRTPRQMQLANAFCRYVEMARTRGAAAAAQSRL